MPYERGQDSFKEKFTEVRSHFRRLAGFIHPDRNPGIKGAAEEEFKNLLNIFDPNNHFKNGRFPDDLSKLHELNRVASELRKFEARLRREHPEFFADRKSWKEEFEARQNQAKQNQERAQAQAAAGEERVRNEGGTAQEQQRAQTAGERFSSGAAQASAEFEEAASQAEEERQRQERQAEAEQRRHEQERTQRRQDEARAQAERERQEHERAERAAQDRRDRQERERREQEDRERQERENNEKAQRAQKDREERERERGGRTTEEWAEFLLAGMSAKRTRYVEFAKSSPKTKEDPEEIRKDISDALEAFPVAENDLDLLNEYLGKKDGRENEITQEEMDANARLANALDFLTSRGYQRDRGWQLLEGGLLKRNYESAKIRYGKALVDLERENLQRKKEEELGSPPEAWPDETKEAIEQALQVFKSTELFQKLVIEERELLHQEEVASWPLEKQSAYKKAFRAWSRLDIKWKLMISGAVATGVFMFTPVGAAAGTTGAAAYFGKRLVRGLTSAFVSNRAAEWADKKIISKKIRAEEKRDDATNRMRSEFAGFGDSFTLEKLQEIQDRHEQTLKKYESDQRKKIFMKAAVMMATGVGVAAAWSFTEQAAFGSPRPDTAHKGSAAEHPKQAGQTGEPGTEHQESSARIRQDQQETKTSKNPYSEDQAKTQSQETKANEAVGQEQTPEPQNPETGAQDHPQPSPEDLRGNNPESLGKYEDVARKGDSVWKMAERQLEKNYGEEFGKLNQAQKTYIVDAIRRKMESEGVDKFGLKGLDSLQEQQKLDFSKVLDDEEWMKEKFGRANGLGEKEIENIIRNNRINAGITENPTPPQEEIELQRSEASDTLMTNTDQAAQIPPPPEIPYEPEIDQIESNIPVGQPEPPELPHPLGVPPLPHPFVHDTFEAAHIPSIEIDYASHLGLSEQQYLPLRGINTDEFLKQVPTRMDLESNPDMLSALEGGRLTAPLHIGDKIQHITLTRGHTDLAERIFMSMPTREMRKMTISQAIELLSKAGR